jgi:hypothetical protein
VPLCPAGQSRTPDCGCCIENGMPSGGNASNCYSEQVNESTGMCHGRHEERCTFDAQCDTENCVDGGCSTCVKANLRCPGPTCGTDGGRCLNSIDGTTRCGKNWFESGRCGCTSNQECVSRTGSAGAFCVKGSLHSASCLNCRGSTGEMLDTMCADLDGIYWGWLK